MISSPKNLFAYLFALAVVFIFSCKDAAKEKGCENFRDGNFEALHRAPGGGSIFIKREGTVQVETDPKTGKYAKLSIKWIDKCSYEMKLVETTFDIPDSIQQFSKQIPFTTEILNSTDKYYVCKTTIKNQYPIFDTLWVSH